MPRCLPEIIYDKTKITPVIDAETSLYKIPYFKDIDYFSNMDSYVNFVKGVEKAVRTNDRYKKYISYLKKEIKLNLTKYGTPFDRRECPKGKEYFDIMILLANKNLQTKIFMLL